MVAAPSLYPELHHAVKRTDKPCLYNQRVLINNITHTAHILYFYMHSTETLRSCIKYAAHFNCSTEVREPIDLQLNELKY